MRTIAAALLFAVFLACSANGQAWTQPQGTVFVKASLGLASTSERYDHRGEVVAYDARIPTDAGAAFSDRSIYLYAEYGAADGITLIGLLPLKQLSVLEPGEGIVEERQTTDLGSAFLGLRIGLEDRVGLPALWALSANLGLRFPLGYRRDISPAVGAGQIDADFFASIGRSLWPIPAYVQAGAGYRFRTGIYGLSRRVACGADAPAGSPCRYSGTEIDYSDELLGRFEAGYTIADRAQLKALAEILWSTETPESLEELGIAFQPEGFPQQRYVRLGGGASLLLFGKTSLSIQGFAAPYARNALRAVEIFVGLQTIW